MTPNADALCDARIALAAATQADDPGVATLYAAVARASLDKARAELLRLEHLLVARERELVRRCAPREQTELAASVPT